MKILGISGKKQSGKSTLADMISSLYKGKVAILPFAAPLKMEVAKACGVSVQCIEDNKSNFRKILQGWGTEFRRNMFGDDYWLRKQDEQVAKFADADLVIIPDVRFLNEMAFITDRGGKVIRIERSGLPSDNHDSEIQLDDIEKWDYLVDNNHDLTYLFSHAQTIVNILNK